METNERDWTDKFAAPLVMQRQRVDAGDATAADLQVFYVKKDPASWTATSMSVLDAANAAIRTTQDESAASAAAVLSIGTAVSTAVTALAIFLRAAIAYRTARSITGPLEDTVGVLRNIAEGEGDLTRRVNQSTGDELGEMGKWFNTFIVKLEGLVGRVAKSTQVVAGSSVNLFAVSHQMGLGAEDMSVQANVVAAAAEQVTRNLQTVAAATEEMTASIGEISKNASAAAAIAAARSSGRMWRNVTMGHFGTLGRGDRRSGEGDQLRRPADQAARAQRHHRGGEGGRGRQGVRGRGERGQGTREETAKATEEISRKIEAIQADTKRPSSSSTRSARSSPR